MADRARSRLEVLSRQFTSAGSSDTSSSYASATGRPSSYARVHGEVSRAPAAWVRVPKVAKEDLTDVKYDKAEGIAKVRGTFGVLPMPYKQTDANIRWALGPSTEPNPIGAISPSLQITINRPEKRNAFRPRTGTQQLSRLSLHG